MSTSVYFLAIIPPEDILQEVNVFKYYARDHFNSSRALRSPTHVTLEPPFQWEDERISELYKTLEAFEAPISSFTMALRNFSAFPPKVIFVDVVPDAALLALQAALQSYLRSTLDWVSDRPDRPFYPHMTIAFKDLRKRIFPTAWDYFSKLEYERSFEVNSFWLLKHDGTEWKLEREFFHES